MFFQHVYDKSLAQASYFIGCEQAGVAAVIDPKRDVDTYLQIAEENNMKITHVFETHIHADFLSGSRELAELTGANMYLSDEGGPDWQYGFAHIGLRNGSIIKVGNLVFEVLHTPGHTPESISFLLTDLPANEEPVMLFTGDFVFVGDIGRPDLLEKAAGLKGTQEQGAHQMFRSIDLFKALPDFIQLWPGHGAGSACGKSLGAVPVSTVGYEKLRNWALQYGNDEPGFVNYLLEDQPEPPRYFATMKKLNKVDRPLLTSVPALKKLDASALTTALKNNIQLIDTRDKSEFAKGFIPGSINIQNNNSFATWAGWFLRYEEPFMLLADDSQHNDIVRKLMRIGLDNIYGYIPSVEVWQQTGGKLEKANVLSRSDFETLRKEKNVEVLDLRGAVEFKEGHVEGAKNLFVGTLPQHLDEVPRDKKVAVYCQAGDRATIGYSILAQQGFSNIANYAGGINDWKGSGHKLETQSK